MKFKLICKENYLYETDLTIGRTYDSWVAYEEEDGIYYSIIDNNGEVNSFHEDMFLLS